MSTKWKFLCEQDGEIRSKYGDLAWVVGEWNDVPGDLVKCRNGLRASPRIIDALAWVAGDVLVRDTTEAWLVDRASRLSPISGEAGE